MIYGNRANMDFDFTAPKGPRSTPSDTNKNIERGEQKKEEMRAKVETTDILFNFYIVLCGEKRLSRAHFLYRCFHISSHI